MNECAHRAGCRAVRDSTLVVWYRFLYAPRTGGAYDSHHRTSGIAGRARRRGGGLGVGDRRGACANRLSEPAYPMVVPYPAGGIVDIATRIVTDKLSEIWHQPIVVETKPGASGNLAWDQVSRAKPDGYTWTFLGPATMANPHMYANLRWSEKSFVPVGATVW